MGGSLPNLDEMVGNALAALRTPWGDPILLNLAALGDRVVLAALFTAVLGWLAWRRHLHAVLLWLSAALFALLFSALPGLLFAAVSSATPIIYAAVLYGFLAVLLGHEVDERWRWLIYGAAALLLSAIAFALLYFAMQRLSEVLAGLSLGLLWVAQVADAQHRHPQQPPRQAGQHLRQALHREIKQSQGDGAQEQCRRYIKEHAPSHVHLAC